MKLFFHFVATVLIIATTYDCHALEVGSHWVMPDNTRSLGGGKWSIDYTLDRMSDVWLFVSTDKGHIWQQCNVDEFAHDRVYAPSKQTVSFTVPSQYAGYEDLRFKIWAETPGLEQTTPIIESQDRNGKRYYGLKDPATGEFIVNPNYLGIIREYGSWGPVKSGNIIPVMDTRNKWGFIDHAGNEVVPCKYDWIGHQEGDCFLVGVKKSEDRMIETVIDPQGHEKTPPKGDVLCRFMPGYVIMDDLTYPFDDGVMYDLTTGELVDHGS